VFSERTANYEAFCRMRIKILNLNIKMTRQKKKPSAYTKKYRFNIEDDKNGQNISCQSPFKDAGTTILCAASIMWLLLEMISQAKSKSSLTGCYNGTTGDAAIIPLSSKGGSDGDPC
jgi:hypothetical protein